MTSMISLMTPPSKWKMPLNADERNVLYLLSRGSAPVEAAVALNMTLPDVEKMLDHLRDRCGARDRAGLIARTILLHWA